MQSDFHFIVLLLKNIYTNMKFMGKMFRDTYDSNVK